jgi:hypothetical protein
VFAFWFRTAKIVIYYMFSNNTYILFFFICSTFAGEIL